MTGKVERVLAEKGFGFIKTAEGKEYFFHRSAVQGDFDGLRQGDDVTFKEGQGPKGPRAESVIPN